MTKSKTDINWENKVASNGPNRPALSPLTSRDRPPIVAVLGHVDHGKTSLLDRIRQTQVALRETGGITQAIGAYKVNFKEKDITFIDTPGHAAFNKMRAYGGQAADLVILVVAADDGVMPQTLESIQHIMDAKVPFLVAINKVDLPGADIERIKNQLSQNGVYLEGYGGDVVAVPVSAKTGEGIDELLEMILLLAQMHEIKGDPDGLLKGLIIESQMGKAGPVGTVVLKNGTLKVGDQIFAGNVSSKVRGMFDENGKRLEKIGPGEAAEVLGFSQIPPVGSSIVKVENSSGKQEALEQKVRLPQLTEEEEKKVKIILKADTTGSLEAIISSLSPEVLVISAGVGEILDSDVLMAQMMKAKIFGFKVKASSQVAKLAESEKVQIKTYQIIYKLFEDLEEETLKLLKDQTAEKILGKAEIVAEFMVEGKRVAGARVLEGKFSQADRLHLFRGDRVVGDTAIDTLRQRSKKVNEVKAKEEFGIVINPLLDFKAGDMLISFTSSKE
ncbi:MAG: translation initiation factor IF-2 [bacterium]|nr:translation initiation factor IF-2 [bacterium]